jgi:hypothetical protein
MLAIIPTPRRYRMRSGSRFCAIETLPLALTSG